MEKVLIISDLHLSNRFNKKKFDYLKKLFNSADKIIINGDFWDGYLCDFDSFINSEWSELFDILISKETEYVYGNHDSKDFSDARVKKFATKDTESVDINFGGKNFHIQHGHKICPMGDHKIKFLKTKTWNQVSQTVFISAYYTNNIVLKLHLDKLNTRIKQWKESNLQPDTYLVTGHTHNAEVDTQYNYINSGFNTFGYGSYITIDNKGNVNLHKTRY